MDRFLNWNYKSKFVSGAEDLVKSLSLTGKLVFSVLLVLFVGSAGVLAWRVNAAYMVDVPKSGGVIREGALGIPRFVNPLLAVTEGDKDMATLVYSGLMRYATDGSLVPDLAEVYKISPDGKTYTFTLKPHLTFHDGKPITAADVAFTIQKVQDTEFQSMLRANWDGVTVKTNGDREISFTIGQAYAPFLENATVGILPKHIWENLNAEQFSQATMNTSPVGSGPYKIEDIKRDDGGAPVTYTLAPFPHYAAGAPKIGKIIVSFYTNEKELVDAYNGGEIDAINGISPTTATELEKSGAVVLESSLARIFGVFFNKDQNSVLAEYAVREALNLSVNRDYIVNTVLQGFGTTLYDPVPASFTGTTTTSAPVNNTASSSLEVYEGNVAKANAILDKAEWFMGADGYRTKKTKTDPITLEFSISTSDAPELKEIANILSEEWKRIGVKVNVKVFEGGYLNQNIIRPRNYEALLFGQVINRNLDLYPFWHSSQKTDPGLNIALYSDQTTDTILERMRKETDVAVRQTDYQKLRTIVADDLPAVFLYSPNFIYVVPGNLKSATIGPLSTANERFAGIKDWYIETDRVWKIFAR